MKLLRYLIAGLAVSLAGGIFFTPAFGQAEPVNTVDSLDQQYLNWFDMSPARNKIMGAGVNRLYEKFSELPAGKKIVVAVIDGGVDTAHADLKGRIWVNSDEIPGNGIDDDHNGYIDDIHGWNFLGNSSGENIRYANMEEIRIIRRLAPQFSGIDSIEQVPPAEREDYKLYLQCKASAKKKREKYEKIRANIQTLELNLDYARKILEEYLGKDTVTREDLQNIDTSRKDINAVKNFLLHLYTNGFTSEGLKDVKEMVSDRLDKQLNPDFQNRYIIGDDPADIHDTDYGNNDVTGPDAFHGTFVSGIITAIRNNDIGINGISENVEIMSVRAIPDGDERDKDVALAIRYAVDNGAEVINMSFGKDFSPHKEFVDDAVRYAEENNVLLVHAAGNDAVDLDDVKSYPVPELNDGTVVTNWITVGASSKDLDKDLPGSFSNYGQKNVDLFAPGVNIISLYPGNKYTIGDGTSFAAPVVSGVASVLLSYHPGLKTTELKELILRHTDKHRHKKVYLPQDDSLTGKNNDDDRETIRFGKLSVTGGIVNVYKAFKKAR